MKKQFGDCFKDLEKYQKIIPTIKDKFNFLISEYNFTFRCDQGVYGIYIYSYAVNTDKAISEAQHVRRLLTQAGDYTTPEFGIWFDMEGDSYKEQYNVSNETYRAIAHTFVSEMNKYGYDNIGIYANLNWWTTILNDTSLDKYPKWVAQYNSQCDYEKDYIMWQYTSKGAVNGISGNVDMNYYYCYR